MLGQDLSSGLEQRLKERKAALANSDGVTAPLQQAAAGFKHEITKGIERLHHDGNHSL
ncbi:hypothetical protein SAMCFNEI73_Ch1803 [Sinorhizobium americanum]|uniref:Uncharacterized protein n=1 Tax=Sinorhizobium americanum TaxID=194963 RepID=A0A1L3LLY4_9HYPH|nr:hypothetical protein SAMCFNEI73_Ch1803 [Sinorhizobium americanum]